MVHIGALSLLLISALASAMEPDPRATAEKELIELIGSERFDTLQLKGAPIETLAAWYDKARFDNSTQEYYKPEALPPNFSSNHLQTTDGTTSSHQIATTLIGLATVCALAYFATNSGKSAIRWLLSPFISEERALLWALEKEQLLTAQASDVTRLKAMQEKVREKKS
jgi:hypothetical protein